MKRIGFALSLVAISLLAIIGCSGDQENSPTALQSSFARVSEKAIGPSEIVFCIDVADSMSQDELSAVVDALAASLANEDLIPDDGSVAVAALVYGDTTGAALGDLTPVTADNLTNVILPALEGLKTDRLVGTAGADLAGALDSAKAILAPRNVNDQHVMIIGSGYANDEAAAEAACGELATAGVMTSAVAYGGDEISAGLLSSCATAGGGYFENGAQDLQMAANDALAFMLQVGLEVSPTDAQLARGEEHTINAVISRGGDFGFFPIQGADVTFEIISGPNMAGAVAVATDTLGQAAFMYTGDGGAGMDQIVVSATHPGTGEALTDTVGVTWMNTAPDCDAGGPYMATVSGDTAMVALDATGSADADGDTLMFHWMADFEGGSIDDPASATPQLMLTGAALCADSLMVDLMVTDGIDTSMCYALVLLDDQRAPIVEVNEDPILLWSPNHKYHTITPEMVFTRLEDACGEPIDLSMVEVLMVTSDEPEDHKGDGKTVNDIMVNCPNHVSLRAERMGGGDGRVYTIDYRITDENSEVTDVEFQVMVPHDSSGREAVDSGDAGYTFVPECSEDE